MDSAPLIVVFSVKSITDRIVLTIGEKINASLDTGSRLLVVLGSVVFVVAGVISYLIGGPKEVIV